MRGRLAPSPTGRLHLGNIFAFLAAWLSVRSKGGTLALRMEDIDPERSRQSFSDSILEDLQWLGLYWDEGPDKGGPFGPYTQSMRMHGYSALLDEFSRRGLVYPCYCTRRELRQLASAPHIGDEGASYSGACRFLDESERKAHEKKGRKPSLRLNVEAALESLGSGVRQENGTAFIDAVLGPQTRPAEFCGGDFALCRSDGVVAYQLAVSADDAAMGITEVVRGDDLLVSTPRQILLFRLMGVEPPVYAHVPLLHDAAGERLAKRHKALEVAALREAGIAAEAVIGYLGSLAGWQERPKAARPYELLSGFSLSTLKGRKLLLPSEPLAAIAAL